MIEILDIYFGYNQNTELFTNLSLKINKGEYLELKGNNGVGKSSLLKILIGTKKPNNGMVTYNGDNIFINSQDKYYNDLCYIGYNNGIIADLSPIENLEFYSKIVKANNSTEDIIKILDQFSLKEVAEQNPKYLSKGQLQRLALSRLCLKNYNIWVLDEPTSGLDREGVWLITQLINSHVKNKGIAIVATHQSLAINNNNKKEFYL